MIEGIPTLNLSSRPLIIWFSSIPVSFFSLAILFRFCGLWGKQVSPKGCRLSDIMAFEIISLLICGYLGVVGFIGWFQLNPSWDYSFYDDENRFYRRSQWVEDHLLIPMLCYQLWNTLLCTFWAEQRSLIMIGKIFVLVDCHPAVALMVGCRASHFHWSVGLLRIISFLT